MVLKPVRSFAAVMAVIIAIQNILVIALLAIIKSDLGKLLIELKFSFVPSIRDWVLRKRGLDGDNSCLKFLFNFRKIKSYIFLTSFYATF